MMEMDDNTERYCIMWLAEAETMYRVENDTGIYDIGVM